MTNELDTRISIALAATAGSIGPLGGTVQALNRIHKDLNARLAAGRLTDAQYAKKAREVLDVLSNFDGLITEAVSTGVIGGLGTR
jgi:hypothetical protein